MTTIVARGGLSRHKYVDAVCVRVGIFMRVSNELSQEASLYNVNEDKKRP